MATGVLLCGHGSRTPETKTEFEAVAAQLRRRLPDRLIETGYLEFARPTIRDGLETLAKHQVRRILALPAMLFAANHVKRDLPAALNDFVVDHPAIDLQFGRDLSVEGKLLTAAADRIGEAEQRAPHTLSRGETLLLVVGRGTAEAEANGTVAKLAYLLREGLGFGWSEVAFAGSAPPPVEPALRRVVKLGFPRILVFPYFLFTGALVSRIYAAADLVAADHPGIEVLKAGYLGDHPLLIDCFIDRINEMTAGDHPHNA